MEWISNIVDGLNKFSGLFSLLAVIVAAVVPYIIYKKQQRDKRLDALDELEAMNDLSQNPMNYSERNYYTRKRVLEKKSKK
jgi:hypothetical protein